MCSSNNSSSEREDSNEQHSDDQSDDTEDEYEDRRTRARRKNGPRLKQIEQDIRDSLTASERNI